MYTYHRHNKEASFSFAEQVMDVVDCVQDAGIAENYSEGAFARLLGIGDNVASGVFLVE